MLLVSNQFKEAMISPVRRFAAEIALQQDNTNLENFSTYTQEDAIKGIEIQRVGDNSKFFGYGICQRLNIKLVDLLDEIIPVSKSKIKVKIGIELKDKSIEYVSYPTFYLTERNRSEDSGEVTLTAYDKLYEASLYTVSDLELDTPYTIENFVVACAEKLGLGVTLEGIAVDDYSFHLPYETGANFSGSENLREALNFAAEATQTIFFIDFNDNLHFRRLDVDGDAIVTITPEDYFTLRHSDNRRLVQVTHVTELGDNVSAEGGTLTGTTQYIRNNPFWELREDIATIVDHAVSNVYGLTINQFDCSWRGFPLLEIGDKINLQQVSVDSCVESAFILDDVISFDGGYGQQTQWSYQSSDAEIESTPSTIGDAIHHTFAKVDRINREITLYASRTEENSQEISSLKINTDSINASVEQIETNLNNAIDGVNDELETIKKQVELGITAEDLTIEVDKIISEGVNSVKTTTGYKFDEDGLTISKSDSEISTTISEDGMTISKNDQTVLTANNQGVETINLTAHQYLTIGKNSRFEDYLDTRTGCFYIGEGTLWLVEE